MTNQPENKIQASILSNRSYNTKVFTKVLYQDMRGQRMGGIMSGMYALSGIEYGARIGDQKLVVKDLRDTLNQ